MENEPSLLDVADEEFAQINKPEIKQEQGSILDIADDEFKKQEEESTQKEFDVAKLEKLKAEGKPLSEVQQRMIFDEQDKVPLLEQAAIGLEKFIPAAAVKVGELSRGAYELAREAVVKPVYVGAKYNLGLATPKETNVAARDAEIALRSGVSGVMSDLEDTAGTIIKGYESGSAFTDKLQGLSADERFKRYRWRERFQEYQQARRDENPDRAAAVLAENVLLQKAAGIATKMQGGNEEDAKAAEKAYSELVLESGLTREELNPYISAIGEVISPISIPGANIATKTIGKYTSKAVQKGGELALKGVVKPIATGVEKAAELTEKGITGVQTGARKLGEYVTGDPDTLIRGGSIAGLISAPQITGTILAAKPAAIATKEIARTFKDIASAVDVGGAAGRRGLVERGAAKPNAGALTKRLFSAESRGGLGRARAADWMIRQGNAITQQGVNGAVLNTILGLPDIESIEQGFEAAGSGFGIGAFTGSRIMERAGAVVDPRTGLAQKIDTIITPDPSSRRADEDADIKRFLSSVDPDLVPKMEKLGSIDERKNAIQTKIDNLEKQKDTTFGPEVEAIKERISKQKKDLEALNKSTPETQKEVLRQVHLAFADEMDLAKTTGKAAGLNNIQVKILDPSEMEGFFRNSYGATLTDAENVIAGLTGKPDLSPQESENLVNARRIVDGFNNEVAGAQSARGLAISESSDLDGNEVPAFMRKQNLQGATIVINGDLVKQLSDEGFNIRNVVGHEMQHALGKFTEVRDMLAPLRRELFDQKIVNEDGTVNKVTQGIYSDDKLDAYADTYAAAMSPSDNGESFKAQFGGDQDKLRAYIKEEILSEIAGRSGNVSGGTRAGLDSIGRQVVDWIEVNTQNGALKKIKETLRKGGIIVDDSGDISTVLGAELTPESLAMIRQYQRQLKNLNQSMVYEEDARKEEVEIPITKILSDRTLQEKFKNSDIFEKEQVATMTAPDGSKQEIPIPPNAGVDPFVGTYRIQGGQLVDESGNPMNLGSNITFGTMPDGTQVEVGTRIARNVDGSPKILSNREIEARSRNRGKVIRNAIDSALSKGALQLEDTGNGNYRGVMSEAQVNAVLALPNTIVSPNLKRQILFVNEILRRKDGTRMYMEYQAAMRGGKSRALAPQIRDEIPIGFQFSKQGNFLITTMSVSRMHDKMNAWLAKKPENLKLWNGDTANFWDDVIKVLDNHSKGERGETGLDPDAAIAIEKKNAVNDLFNVWNADTKAANPRRTKLPVQKGKDPIDVIVRARRIDRINQYNESSLKKMPFNYELNTKNYMPAENPLADFQTPEDFANELPSVTAEEIRNAINTGNLDQVESRLREGDDLKPAESLDEKDGNIRIVSMFDNEFMPQESLDFVDVKPQFMPAVSVIPERFTGKPEDNRRGRYIAPPSFFNKFDIGEYERGGKFFDTETGEEITDKIYQTGTIDVSGKSPKLVSEQSSDDLGEGKTYKTNLFKKSAGWEWVSENPPEVASIGKNPVLISVEGGKEHKYALKVDFTNGVQLKRYADKPSEPRLRPTGKGDLNLGNIVGEIDIRGKQHPVYDTITIGQPQFMPEQPTKYEPISARIRPLEGISAPTKVVGAKGLSLGEIEPPVRGKAMLPDMELKPDSSEKSIQSSDIITSAKPAPDAVIKPFSNALVSSAGLINFLPAFHGTPHEVDKFRVKNIGTGEGGQSYGWGLYFAQARQVGETYKKKLSGDVWRMKNSSGYLFGSPYLTKEEAMSDFNDVFKGRTDIQVVKVNENAKGNLYKVDLDVKDEDLLDWDKPLSEQSEKVKSLITKIADQLKDKEFRKNASKTQAILARKSYEVVENSGLVGDEDFQEQPMSVFYNDIAQELSKQLNTDEGNNVYTLPENTKATSEALLAEGIPGIRYLDGASRVIGEGTYNYVVFDENLIKILDKNDKPVQDELPRATGLQFMPSEGEVKSDIPVAKTDTEEESSDNKLISTGVDVPESVDEQSNISNALTIANSQSWRKGRDFKLDIQNRVLEAAKKAGVQISERTAEAIEYLARVGLKDGLLALDQNPNAIGWYDEKTKQALGVMSLMFPEIETDPNARFAFTWGLAVTSNGLKVDKNFELAERVYREFRKTGKMPTNIEAGQAQKAINEGLDLFNKLTKDWGVENTRKFMQTDFTVGEISRLSKELSPGGEFADTNVRGSAILGPKIGNGFFSNLYGMFDALTMDRWLVRTWGRWTGTLVEFNPELTELAKNRLQETINNLTPEDKARMDAMLKNDISQMGLEYLSVAIQKASMKPEMRQLMNTTATGEEFRKAGNGYAKYMDGQKEAPSGPTERNFIREIFGLMLDELKSYPKYKDLTMADLQAVLWYAEKRLYETAKIKSDQDSLDSSDADGYEDDDAPDYANAAIGVARKKGVSEKKIQQVLENIKNDRTTTTRPETIEGNQPESEQQKSAGGFVGKEKQKFKQYVAVTTARRNRTGNEAALWTYARRSGSDGSNAGVLKPKSKKNLGVKYISEWKPGRKLATMFRNNELPPVKFLELDSTDKASAQKFADTIQQSKESSLHGASVYVYPTEDYQGMNLFLSDSGRSGFAVKPDGDIVSVFSMEKGSGRSIMEAAIAAGGKKLDAFDTILPEFYGEHGFIEAARIPWNDEFSPDGWDKQTFKKYNNGEPDVVMMVLDPKFEGEYEPRTDVYTTEYDQAVKMQNSMLRKIEKKRK